MPYYDTPVVTPILYAGPSVEPVSLAEMGKWVGAYASTDDAILSANITAARQWFETACDRSFVLSTWDYKFPYFFAQEIALPYPPLRDVVSITYLDVNEASQTLATTVYDVVTSRTPGVVRLAWSQVWPVVAFRPEAVTIRFRSGSTAGCPEMVKAGIKMLAAFWYANRGDQTITGANQQPVVPMAVQNIATAASSFRF